MATRLDRMMTAAAAYNKIAEQYDESFHSNVALAEGDVWKSIQDNNWGNRHGEANGSLE